MPGTRILSAGLFAGLVAASFLAVAPSHAQQTVKIGVILPYSGQFADPGAQIDNGIKLYMQQHGDTVAGKKIEIVRRDTGGIAPDVAKRLAQELIVRDNVDILTGFSLSPNAFAVADLSAQAKKFMVLMNAATAIITTKSPYIARTSFTLPQLNEPLGIWAYKNGVRKVYSMVADFAAGHDAEAAFQGAPAAAASGFTVNPGLDKTTFDTELGLSIVGSKASGRLAWTGQFGDRTRNQTLSLKIAVPF